MCVCVYMFALVLLPPSPLLVASIHSKVTQRLCTLKTKVAKLEFTAMGKHLVPPPPPFPSMPTTSSPLSLSRPHDSPCDISLLQTAAPSALTLWHALQDQSHGSTDPTLSVAPQRGLNDPWAWPAAQGGQWRSHCGQLGRCTCREYVPCGDCCSPLCAGPDRPHAQWRRPAELPWTQAILVSVCWQMQ